MVKDKSTGLVKHKYSDLVFELDGTEDNMYYAIGYKHPETKMLVRAFRDIDLTVMKGVGFKCTPDVPHVNDGSDQYYAKHTYIPNQLEYMSLSNNTKKKNQESKKKKIVLQYDNDHKLIQTFQSASHAATVLGISQGTVSLRCNNKSKQDRTYILSYDVLEEIIESNQ